MGSSNDLGHCNRSRFIVGESVAFKNCFICEVLSLVFQNTIVNYLYTHTPQKQAVAEKMGRLTIEEMKCGRL
jgi:hypothetical protein